MKKKVLALCIAVILSASGATACGAVQDEVNQQRTKAEQRVQQEKTKALEKAKTTVGQ